MASAIEGTTVVVEDNAAWAGAWLEDVVVVVVASSSTKSAIGRPAMSFSGRVVVECITWVLFAGSGVVASKDLTIAGAFFAFCDPALEEARTWETLCDVVEVSAVDVVDVVDVVDAGGLDVVDVVEAGAADVVVLRRDVVVRAVLAAEVVILCDEVVLSSDGLGAVVVVGMATLLVVA